MAVAKTGGKLERTKVKGKANAPPWDEVQAEKTMDPTMGY